MESYLIPCPLPVTSSGDIYTRDYIFANRRNIANVYAGKNGVKNGKSVIFKIGGSQIWGAFRPKLKINKLYLWKAKRGKC
jgi:hypothetical protein